MSCNLWSNETLECLLKQCTSGYLPCLIWLLSCILVSVMRRNKQTLYDAFRCETWRLQSLFLSPPLLPHLSFLPPSLYLSHSPVPTYREPLLWVDLDHALEQRLAVGRDEWGHMEHPTLHLLQQLPQVVMVEWQRTLDTEVRKDKRRLGLTVCRSH